MTGSFEIRGVALWVLAAAAGGCFEDSTQGPADDGDPTSSGADASGGTVATPDSGAPATDGTAGSGAATTAPDSTGASGQTDGSDTTQGAPPLGRCDCPADSLLCAPFEGPLQGWITDAGGEGAELPAISEVVRECGRSSLRTAVAAGALYSRAAYPFEPGDVQGTVRLRTLLYLEGKCIGREGQLTQALDLAFDDPAGDFAYRIGVWIEERGGAIIFTGGGEGQGGLAAAFNADAIVADQWFELELEIDFTPNEPRAQAFVDGEFVAMGDGYPSPMPLAVDTMTPTLNLGPLQPQAFDASCIFNYDALWVDVPAPP